AVTATNLLIFGASARAAAFSAIRAGLRPWCADLFADADLASRCPTIRVPPRSYPLGFGEIVARDLPGPWMYTGGLENWRTLVHCMARTRPLWGNSFLSLLRSRTPGTAARLLATAGVPCPAVRMQGDELPRRGRWLVKPVSGAGGTGIRFWGGR